MILLLPTADFIFCHSHKKGNPTEIISIGDKLYIIAEILFA